MLRIGMIVALLACFSAFAFAQFTEAPGQLPAQPNSVHPGSPQRIRVSGGVMLGLVEHKAMPEYPEEAMTKGLQGDVIFKIAVDETGKIVLSVPVEGDPLLVAASVDALRGFHFRPYLLNGSPVGVVESQLGFHFSLGKKGGGTTGQVECMSSIPYRPEFRTGVVNDKGVLVLAPRKVSGVEYHWCER